MHVNLQDLRLEGIAPAADLNLVVNRTDSLGGTMTRIRQYALAQAGPVTLDIMCHGFESHSDPVGQQSLADGFGGGGLELCRENLNLGTVNVTTELDGVVESITVYSCSAAETHPNYAGTNWDGQQLFREMAAHTNATIYAADATQWYWNRAINLGNASSSVIDFRRFEGNLYRFTPDCNVTVVEANQLAAH